ncbi:MAG: SPFH domain-containing protein [Alphaproteobacteria bacterium]
MVEFWLTLLIVVIVVIAIVYILSIWVYKRAPANMAFIRTGFLGTKVCVGQGAVVLPVFHEISWVSLETIKLIISRARDQAVLTSDKIRIDLGVEVYAHVGRANDEVLTASRSLGDKTFDPDKVRNLLEAKVVSAVRSYAATKTLNELHENRDIFAKAVRESVVESFHANGLMLEEVTVVALEQTAKDYFKPDNVFDAEGLKIITEITSDARRKVHATEKRTTVAIRQKDLDTQLELLEIERKESFARASQDMEVSNEQALRLGEKQVYVLDQRMSVEQREIENEKELEHLRTEREVAITEEAQKREAMEIRKELALEAERRQKEITLIAKAKEEELANIERRLSLEKAEKDREIELVAKAQQEELAEISRELARESAEKQREIELIGKEKERQQADIQRATAVLAEEEKARDERHKVAEETVVAMRKRALDTRLAVLDIEKEEEFAATTQEREVSDQRARELAETQQFLLDQRWRVQKAEIDKDLAVEKARIVKEAEVADQMKVREAAEVRRALAREQEERDREIALVAKDEELRRAEVRQAKAIELEEQDREIELIEKEKERETADIRRFLARELEEREREIALVQKTQQLEAAEVERLKTTAEKERGQHSVESIRVVADAERTKEIERIRAEQEAVASTIAEEAKAEVSKMHVVTQSEARNQAAAEEAKATMTRAKTQSDAQKIGAEGIEREAGAQGRAEMEIDGLRAANTQRLLEAEAAGIEAKAGALKKYNDAATFLELAKLHIEAERDIHIDQAKAMGNALQNAQIRMYGGGGGDGDGTIDTIRGLFTQGFGLGEVLEGVAQSLPEGLKQRFAANGIRGLFGRPYGSGNLKEAFDQLKALVEQSMRSRKAREIPLSEALPKLIEQAGDDEAMRLAVDMLKDFNAEGTFDDVPFETVWTLLQAAARNID